MFLSIIDASLTNLIKVQKPLCKVCYGIALVYTSSNSQKIAFNHGNSNKDLTSKMIYIPILYFSMQNKCTLHTGIIKYLILFVYFLIKSTSYNFG
jgi:hypothetical protein